VIVGHSPWETGGHITVGMVDSRTELQAASPHFEETVMQLSFWVY